MFLEGARILVRMKRFLTCLAAVAFAAAAARGQQPTFRAGSEAVRVFVTVTEKSGRLVPALTQDRFEVRDEGTGVPAHLLAKLFTPLRSPKSGGHGIGLAIGRQLANHLGAVLELKTSSPTGSVFELRLPRSRLAGQGLLDSRAHGG